MTTSTIILAAGQGTRMRSGLPKVLQPLGGRPMLAHVLDTVSRLEDTRVYVVHGHGGERVQAAFQERQLQWVHQAERLGTGQAVMRAMGGIAGADLVRVFLGAGRCYVLPTLLCRPHAI